MVQLHGPRLMLEFFYLVGQMRYFRFMFYRLTSYFLLLFFIFLFSTSYADKQKPSSIEKNNSPEKVYEKVEITPGITFQTARLSMEIPSDYLLVKREEVIPGYYEMFFFHKHESSTGNNVIVVKPIKIEKTVKDPRAWYMASLFASNEFMMMTNDPQNKTSNGVIAIPYKNGTLIHMKFIEGDEDVHCVITWNPSAENDTIKITNWLDRQSTCHYEPGFAVPPIESGFALTQPKGLKVEPVKEVKLPNGGSEVVFDLKNNSDNEKVGQLILESLPKDFMGQRLDQFAKKYIEDNIKSAELKIPEKITPNHLYAFYEYTLTGNAKENKPSQEGFLKIYNGDLNTFYVLRWNYDSSLRSQDRTLQAIKYIHSQYPCSKKDPSCSPR